jgi:Cytochrome c oxidase subunit III/NADH-ubiquinone/plastoquinone oxidoreductase, chain 3
MFSNKIKLNFAIAKVVSYIEAIHFFHLVDPSPWPILSAFSAYMLTNGLVLYMHKYIGGWDLLKNGLYSILFAMCAWFRDVIREGTFENVHTIAVQRGLRLGMILFIVSEIMFLIPWSVSLAKLNLIGFWAMLDFLFELIIGFGYLWSTGILFDQKKF